MDKGLMRSNYALFRDEVYISGLWLTQEITLAIDFSKTNRQRNSHSTAKGQMPTR